MAQADDDAPKPGGKLEPGALVLGVTALLGAVGTFSLTGTTGRVLRNAPDEFAVALLLLLFGAAAFMWSALPLSSGPTQTIAAAVAIGLSLVGLAVGLVAAAGTADDDERPAISATLSGDGLHLTGTATAANLSAKARLVVLVDGLVAREGGSYRSTTLLQAYVGPDSDGKVTQPLDLRLPPGRFDAVGIRSWTSKGATPIDEQPCSEYPRQAATPVSKLAQEAAGTGCLVLPLTPVPVGPRLSLRWDGDDAATSTSLRVGVATDNAPARLSASEGCVPGPAGSAAPGRLCAPARVVVQVYGKTAKRTMLLYRAVLQPDAAGKLASVVHLPVPKVLDRICATAGFAYGTAGFPASGCPQVPIRPDYVLAELHPPTQDDP
jgi:hypothetical protein